MVSPRENGFENCIAKPLSTLPRMSLAAKAVATPRWRRKETKSRLKVNFIKKRDRFPSGSRAMQELCPQKNIIVCIKSMKSKKKK